MPVSPACFHSTAITLPQACLKYSIFSRDRVEKCKSITDLTIVPLLASGFFHSISRIYTGSPSRSYPLPLETQAPLVAAFNISPSQRHASPRMRGSQTLMDDALPKEEEASNKDDLKA